MANRPPVACQCEDNKDRRGRRRPDYAILVFESQFLSVSALSVERFALVQDRQSKSWRDCDGDVQEESQGIQQQEARAVL